jgi:hypothetical protein
MYIVRVSLPVVVTGRNQMGWPSFASVQAGDKVRLFTETGKDGKPKAGGRPQFRVTTYGQIDNAEPSPIEIVGNIDHEVWDVLEGELLAAAPLVHLEITGVVQMNGDEMDRVKMGSKSWIGGALILNLISVSASKGQTVDKPWKRIKPALSANTAQTSID